MCTKLPCAPNIYFSYLNGSDHAEYTRKSQLTENESKCHKNNKGSCGQK